MPIIAPIIMLGLLIFVHELGHFVFAKIMGVKVLKFSLGFGKPLIARKIGETEYQIAIFPLGGYVKMFGEESGEEMHLTGEGEEAPEPISEVDMKRAFSAQHVWKRMMIVLAGPVSNLLLTFVLFAGFLAADMQVPIPSVDDIGAVVGEVQEGMPAQKAGLQGGDEILRIDGKTVNTWYDLAGIISAKPGEKLEFTIRRGDEELTFNIAPVTVTEKDRLGNEVEAVRIGIKKAEGEPPYIAKAHDIPSALTGAAMATWKLSVLVIDVLKGLVTGTVSFKTIGGPITIVDQSVKAASLGIAPYLFFMAFISTNLGVINLFPIPILDGGHIVFLAYEGIARKPADERVVGVAQRIGLVLLLMLIVLVTYNDIFRLFE